MDSLKTFIDSTIGTAVTGAGGVALSYWEIIPEILRILILIATLTHISIKALKEIKTWI